MVTHTDLNCLSVIQFAVDVLKVKHIIVVGHYGCGGVGAALRGDRIGLSDNWLRHVSDVAAMHRQNLDPSLPLSVRHNRLCELNAIEQAIDMLLPVFGAALQNQGGTALFLDGRLLTEFLETPTTTPVSSIHAFWLASLLWLARRGWSLQLSKTELGLQGKVVQAEPALTPDHLAAWIEQF